MYSVSEFSIPTHIIIYIIIVMIYTYYTLYEEFPRISMNKIYYDLY